MDTAQPVGEGPGGRGTDPAGMSREGGDSAIDRLGEFEGYKGDAGGDKFEEYFVYLQAGRLGNTNNRVDARPLQGGDALAGHQGIGIGRADYHPCRLGLDERLHAGGGLAIVTARFQCYIDGSAGNRFLSIIDGIYLGVGTAVAPVITIA